MQSNNVVAEDADAGAPGAAAPGPEEQQTVEIPLSAFASPPKPGAMVQMKVISVDANSGVVNAVPMAPENMDEGGSDSMAKEFDQPTA
jgi:hypothetical protein